MFEKKNKKRNWKIWNVSDHFIIFLYPNIHHFISFLNISQNVLCLYSGLPNVHTILNAASAKGIFLYFFLQSYSYFTYLLSLFFLLIILSRITNLKLFQFHFSFFFYISEHKTCFRIHQRSSKLLLFLFYYIQYIFMHILYLFFLFCYINSHFQCCLALKTTVF